ncbi:MAG: hypothetical protein GY804_01295 [Alphaproteobacteria bacterium]|nr:hypothetical protein [Alphaproteobacteria bacterium]
MSEKKSLYPNIIETPEDILISILAGLSYLENEAKIAGFNRLSCTIKRIRKKPSIWLKNKKSGKNTNEIIKRNENV